MGRSCPELVHHLSSQHLPTHSWRSALSISRGLHPPAPRSTAPQAVEAGAARKAFDLSLPQLGPYTLSFTRSGRHMLLAGRKGHLALMDWQRSRLICEVQVRGWLRAHRRRSIARRRLPGAPQVDCPVRQPLL